MTEENETTIKTLIINLNKNLNEQDKLRKEIFNKESDLINLISDCENILDELKKYGEAFEEK